MKRSPGCLPRLIGAINIAVGICVIARNFRWLASGGIWEWVFMLRGEPGVFSTQERILIFALSVVVVPLIPAAKIVTGGGLLFAKKWAYRSTLLVVVVDFIINLYSTINYVNLEPAIPSMPYHGGDTVMMGMLPIYLVALFDLLVIAILTREEVCGYFRSRQPAEKAPSAE